VASSALSCEFLIDFPMDDTTFFMFRNHAAVALKITFLLHSFDEVAQCTELIPPRLGSFGSESRLVRGDMQG